MKLKYWLAALISLFILLFASHATKAQSQSVPENFPAIPPPFQLTPLPQTQSQTQTFKIGHVEDSQPVSSAGRETGFCDALSSIFRANKPEKVKIPFDSRFIHSQGVAIECGPNSITKERIDDLQSKLLPVTGVFTKPFFRTETKIVIRNSKRHLLSPQDVSPDITDSGNSSFTVAVIEKTTTEDALKKIYPNAKLVEVKDRTAAINRLRSDSSDPIDAYISDEVLLPKVLQALGQDASQFSIEPKLYGLTNEYYGIVIYNDPNNLSYKFDELLNTVESWLNRQDGLREVEKLKRELDYNATSNVLKWFISTNWLYYLPLPLLILLVFLLSIALFLFLFWILPQLAQTPPIQSLFNRLGGRRQNSRINQVVNVFVSGASNTLIPNYIDRNAVATLLSEFNEPIVQANVQTSSIESEETEQVIENLASRAESDSYFRKVLKAMLVPAGDATREEASEWWKTVVKRALERIEESVQNTFNP